MNSERHCIENKCEAYEIEWQGPGYYAPREEYTNTGWITRYYYVGQERTEPPGLGTPAWFASPHG